MKKKLFFILLSINFSVFSQNSGISINPAGNNPNPSAGLDVDYNNKGFLMPRLTTVQRDAIQNPAVGLQIYNTTTNCFQLYSPISAWHNVACDCQNFPSSAFTFPDSAAVNSNVSFQASTPGSTYSWTFDQGSPATSNQQSPTVTWSSIGYFNITLTVTDALGCSSTTMGTIKIINCPPPLSLNFTNCGQTGRTGPAQNQCNSTYGSTPLNGMVTVVNGIQQWTVPDAGNYLIEVAGADGGEGNGRTPGRGVIVSAEVALNQGDVLNILVGQRGALTSGAAGGGGGSYVVLSNNNTPLVIAGGGSGTTTNSDGFNGLTTTSGGAGQNCAGNGGTNGNGGGDASGCNNGAGGGGGFLTDGASGSSWGVQRGYAFMNGGAGGTSSSGGAIGGFGGGAGTHTNNTGGGAAGGYSGGGASYHGNGYSGGGGGSYIIPTASNASTSNGQYDNSGTFNGSPVTNLASYNNGHGYVNITLVCP